MHTPAAAKSARAVRTEHTSTVWDSTNEAVLSEPVSLLSAGGSGAVAAALGAPVGQRARDAIRGLAPLGLVADLPGAPGRGEGHARPERRERRPIRRAA